MKKSFKQYLAIFLVFCFFFSEWGNYGFTVNAAASSLTISGANTISTIKKGNSWTCKGTVSSNCMLKEVRGTIYESDGLTVKYRKSVSPNSSTYTLQNGEIDRALLFNTLQPGTYYYAIDATDASGTKKTLVNNKFTVQGSGGSTLKITGASTISSLKQGNLWTCRGTVSSNYVLKEVKGTIYESDGIKVRYQKSVYPNKKSYKIQNGEIDKALLFNNLSAGTYYYTIVASDVSGRALTLVRNKFTVQGQSIAASTLKITGASTISSLKQGSSWTCKGTVSSNYVLKEVRGTIYESNGITVKYRKSVYPNSKSYKIQNGEIDRALLFNKLPAGTYHYTIVAFDMSGIEKTLVNNKFIVQGKTSAASKLKITGASKISSIQQGKSWSCKGTVSSNYVLKEVRGTIYESDGITVKYRKSVYPNGKSYKIQNGEIDKALLFNKLPAGTYHYTIVAQDTSGEKERTLVNNKFVVQGKANTVSSLKITNASTISSIQQGDSWTCKGIVNSNYLIKEVQGTIYESNGITIKYRKSIYPNSKSFNIERDGRIGETLSFHNLPVGTYHYTIVAKDASGENEKMLINNKFTVKANPSAFKITGSNQINSLKQGNSWTCKGTVSSNYLLKEVRGTIYESDGITVKYRKSVYPYKKSYNIQKDGKIGKELLFHKLSVGTYYYTIVVKDVLGVEKTLVNNKFSVQAKASAISITGASRIKSLQEGASWICKGIVKSNFSLKEVRGIIYESNGITIKYKKSVFPFSNTYDIQKGNEIGRELLFSSLSPGTYHYTIVAKDILGTEKTLVNDKFVVKPKDFGPVAGKKTEKDILQAINERNRGIEITENTGCVKYVKDKLNKMGYRLGGGTGNGIDWYKNFENGHNLLKGYSAECVGGNDSLKKLTNKHEGETLYNVIISFGTGKSGNYREYGHVMLVDCIKDGKVYFSEMYSYKGGFESGKATVLTIDKFLEYYNDTYNGIKGVVRLTKSK